MAKSLGCHIPCSGEPAGSRIVELRTGDRRRSISVCIETGSAARDQNRAVRKKIRRMAIPWRGHPACETDLIGCGVIQFGQIHITPIGVAAGKQDLAVH